jgi:hypothetical protein
MKSKANKSPRKKAPIIIASVIVLVLAGSVAVYALITKPSSDTIPASQQGVNLEKSDAEKAAIQNLKDNPNQKTENNQNDTPTTPTQTTSSGKRAVNVSLSYADIRNGTVTASGGVTNITEDNGTCTYSFVNGSLVVTKTSTTLVNPTSTTCKTVSFPSTELSSNGTWKVTLSYSSTISEGTSNQKDIIK